MPLSITQYDLLPRRRDGQVGSGTSISLGAAGNGGGGSTVDLTSYAKYEYVDGSLAERDASITFLFNNKVGLTDLYPYATNVSVGTAFGLRDTSITWLYANKVSKYGDTMTGDLTVNASLSINGNTKLTGHTTITGDTSIMLVTGQTGIRLYWNGEPGLQFDDNQFGIPGGTDGGTMYLANYSTGTGDMVLGKFGAGQVQVYNTFNNLGKATLENIESSLAYVSGFAGSGFKFWTNGSETFGEIDNLNIRRLLSAYELQNRKVTSVNGGFIVSVANGTPYLVSGTRFYFDEDGTNNQIQFVVGDVVLAQIITGRGTGSYKGSVTAVNHSSTYGSAYIDCTTISGTPWSNMNLAQVGHPTTASRQNLIYITASDTNNPYIDFLTGVTDGDFAGHLVARVGNLTGITDVDFGVLSGMGGYFKDNIYIKGHIIISSGSGYSNLSDKPGSLAAIDTSANSKLSGIAAGATVGATWGTNLNNIPATLSTPSGSGLFLSSTNMGYYTGGTWKTYIDSNGNLILGDIAGGNTGLSWNQGTGVLSIKGSIVLTGGSGYSNLSDKPTSLSGINGTEGSKLSGIEAGATVGATSAQVSAINTAQLLATATNYGKMLYRDPTFISGNNSIGVYNNNGNGTVTHSRTSQADSPNYGTSAYDLTITYTAGGGGASPGYGGFYFGTQSRANAILVTRIVAKVPVGRTIEFASNGFGTGSIQQWLTAQAGTDRFEEYICYVKCGYTGSFSSTNFFYINGGADSTFSWYASFATVYDLTDTDISYINAAATTATWAGVSGTGKPADNATVGATWGTNLYSVPAFLGTPGSSGLYVGSTYMGYYNGSSWASYIDNAGNSKFVGVTEIGTNAQTLGGSSGNVAIKGCNIWENSVAGSSDILINVLGYNSAASGVFGIYPRNVIIGDGCGIREMFCTYPGGYRDIEAPTTVIGTRHTNPNWEDYTDQAFVINAWTHMQGSMDCLGSAAFTGGITSEGDITAYYTSDERLKQNIKPFTALDIIDRLKPVTYNWNDKAKEYCKCRDSSTNNFGLIAQEVEQVLPELIHPMYNEETKGIDYIQFIPILIQAIREQQKQIDELKNKSL